MVEKPERSVKIDPIENEEESKNETKKNYTKTKKPLSEQKRKALKKAQVARMIKTEERKKKLKHYDEMVKHVANLTQEVSKLKEMLKSTQAEYPQSKTEPLTEQKLYDNKKYNYVNTNNATTIQKDEIKEDMNYQTPPKVDSYFDYLNF